MIYLNTFPIINSNGITGMLGIVDRRLNSSYDISNFEVNYFFNIPVLI